MPRPHGRTLISGGEIILSGPVVSDMWAGWMCEGDVFIAPVMLREAFAEIAAGPVTVRLNSVGGDTDAGEQIRAMLAQRGNVTVIVEGYAMSAASLLLMGAADRVMSEGSILMIHEPTTGAWGTAEELRHIADATEIISNVYAQVYATASGQTLAEVQRMLAEETYMGPQEAVALGFADRVAGNAAAAPANISQTMRAQFQAAMSSARQMVMARLPQTNPDAGRQPAPVTAPLAQIQQAPAGVAIMEGAMPPEVTPTNPVAANPAPVAPAMAADVQAELARDRQRGSLIRMSGNPFIAAGRLTEAEVQGLIDSGVSHEAAAAQMMATMAAREPIQTRSQPATITRDEGETKMEGMIGALMGATDGPAAEFRGLRLKSLAMHLAGPSRGFGEASAVRSGMLSTKMTGGAFGVSDFAYITTSVMNRTLQAEYKRRGATWQAVAGKPLPAADFRALASVRFGGDFQLKKVLENGEYQGATLKDEASSLKVERRGRTISLAFESIINDDMGALTRIPTEFAWAARIMENSMVWALIRNNTVMTVDNVALFHASHGNLAGVAAAISAASVGSARKAMWEQRAVGVKDSDDFMQIEPNLLIVPPALELVALQFVAPTVPTADGSANPYKSTLTPVVVPNLGTISGGSDTAWYLISSDAPPISVAYLDGYESPTVQTVEGMNPDIVTMNARHIFGAAATEFRGAHKNPGV